MNRDLYNDNFMRLFTDGQQGYYADALRCYIIIPLSITHYIVKRLKEDYKRGYKLLDYYFSKKPRKIWKNV